MKTKLLCILVAALLANCVSAQEQYIQVKTVNNGRKTIDITFTNTSDQKMRIYCRNHVSHTNSGFVIWFLDKNGKTLAYRGDVTFMNRDEPKQSYEMIEIEPHSSKMMQFEVRILMEAVGEPVNRHLIKTFKVKYYIKYFFPDADRSSDLAGFFVYEMTTDPIAF